MNKVGENEFEDVENSVEDISTLQSIESNSYITDDPNWKGVRYFIPSERLMTVKFSLFYGKESIIYEEFITSCVSKKAYNKMMRYFAYTNNMILNANKKLAQEFLYKYYCIKRSIDEDAYSKFTYSDGNHDYSSFINSIVNLFDISLINEIRKFVNANYIETGDEIYKKNKSKFIPGITFLDYHIKILFIISSMTHFIIPLCLEYIRQYREVNTKEFLVDCFTALFPIAEDIRPGLVPIAKQEERVNIYQKLYEFVKFRVNSTLDSDKAMWKRLEFASVNYKKTIESILREKLITDILPEFLYDRNVMNLAISVVRTSIQNHTLRRKDPYNMSCLSDVDASSQQDDNAIITEAERFSSYSARKNELIITLQKEFTQDTIDKIMFKNNITIDNELFEYYKDNISHHEFQKFVIFSAFSRYFGGTENMYSINIDQYILLMLSIVQSLNREATGCILSKYILGIKNRHYISNKRDSRFNKSLLQKEPNASFYNYILNTKYKHVINIVTKKGNFIEKQFNFLLNNEFLYNVPDMKYRHKIIQKEDDETILNSILQFVNLHIE